MASPLLRAPRGGPHADRLAAAGADARPGRGRGPGRLRAEAINSANARSGARSTRQAGRRRSRRAAGLPRTAEQPATSATSNCRSWSPDGPAGDRRGPLHLRLGPRLPARLPPHQRPDRRAAARHARAGHHRDRQRAGGRRRRRAARRRRRRCLHPARTAGPRVAAPGRAALAERRAPSWRWLPTHLEDLPGSGIIYTLTVSAAEDITRCCARPGTTCSPTAAAPTPRNAPAPSRRSRTTRSRRWWRPARWAWGSTSRTWASWCTSGARLPGGLHQQVGRAGRASTRRRAAAARARGPGNLALLRHLLQPDDQRAHAVLAELEAAGGALSRRPGGQGQPAPHPLELLLKVLAVDGAVQRVQGGWASTGQPWFYDAERYGRVAAARLAEQNRCWSTSSPPAAGWSSWPGRWTTPTPPVRAVRQLRRPLVRRRDRRRGPG